MSYDKDTYFVNLPDEQIAEACMQRVDDYFSHLTRSGVLALWKTSYNAYYNSEIVGGQINRTGAQNEFSNLNVNHYRSILTTLKGMIAQQKLAYDSKATNTDVKSQAQAILSNGLLEYYTKEKTLEDFTDEGLESAIVLSEGWIYSSWNVQGGEVYGYHPETNAPIYEGDIRYQSYLPTQVVRDVTKRKFSENNWFILIDFINKWDLIEQFPEYTTQIMDTSKDSSEMNRYRLYSSKHVDAEQDDIPVFTLIHKKTPSVPNGKEVRFINDEVTLNSGALPYRGITLRCITTSKHLASNFGYTLAYDLLPIQQAINIIDSIIITNQSTYGCQNVIVTRGSNVGSETLAGGLNLIEYTPVEGGAPPSSLTLVQTAAELFNYRASLVQDMQLISGINAVSRGDMSSLGKTMSGAAMALIQNMAIQYANSLQKSYVRTLGDIGTDTIMILRDFAKVPRIAMISGIANRPYMKEFTGDDLNMINRVEIDVGNAMAQTLAGRVDLADKYIEKGWARSPQEYTQVLTTGRLDAVIEGPQRINLQIRQENEDLSNDKGAIAIKTDKHVEHIEMHSSILDGLEARQNPELVKAVTMHIEEHLSLLKMTDPMLLTILKQPVMQQPPMPPPGEPTGAGDGLNAEPQATQQAQEVNQPNLPESPIPVQQ